MSKKDSQKRRRRNNKNVARAPTDLMLIDGNYSFYYVAYCKRKNGYLTKGLINTHKCDVRKCEQLERYEVFKMESKVTRVDVKKYENGNVLGFANITINGDIVITGVSIINGKKDRFIAFPNKKGNDNNYYDIVFPVSAECRNTVTDAVLRTYDKMIKAKKDYISVEYN